MIDESTIVKRRQLAIRRELDRRRIAMKVIQMDSGIAPATLASYFPADSNTEPHGLPVAALHALCGAMPEDLLSLLLPDGFLVVRAPENIDHDQLAEAMQSYLAAKHHAHHPESPAGREIAPCEDNDLRGKFAVVVGGRG